MRVIQKGQWNVRIETETDADRKWLMEVLKQLKKA